MATCACKLLAAGVVVGAGLAFLYAGNAGEAGLKSGSLWGAAVAYGIGIAYIVLSIVECILQGRAVKADSLGGGVEWSDRGVAAEQGGALKGKSMVARDARALLGAWGAGASGPQVARMAATQTGRWVAMVAGEAVAVWAICSAGDGFAAPQELLSLGTAVMVGVALAALWRLQTVVSESKYVEAKLLSQIGNDTAAAAANALTERAGKNIEAAMGKLEETAKKAGESIAAAQEKSVAKLAQNQAEVAKQLDRVAGVASSVESLLQLQKNVDATLKTVTVTNEFQSTLAGLRQHLSEADSLLKEARKPRKIRLVEDPGQG
jgi:hypothetical protein